MQKILHFFLKNEFFIFSINISIPFCRATRCSRPTTTASTLPWWRGSSGSRCRITWSEKRRQGTTCPPASSTGIRRPPRPATWPTTVVLCTNTAPSFVTATATRTPPTCPATQTASMTSSRGSLANISFLFSYLFLFFDLRGSGPVRSSLFSFRIFLAVQLWDLGIKSGVSVTRCWNKNCPKITHTSFNI